MKIIEYIKNKNNLPIVLFAIILLNHLPLFVKNAFSKESVAVGTVPVVICFVIEILLIFFIYLKNSSNIKNVKNKTIILFLITLILFLVQIKNILENNFLLMDIFNIICIFINILLFYVIAFDFQLDSKKISVFFSGIFWTGIVAVIWNFCLFNQEILGNLGITDSYAYNLKGFFANRNSLAFFIFLSVVANAFLMSFNKEKKIYKFSFLFFMFGVWCTYSKTGFLLTTVFIELFILLNNNYKLKSRILAAICIGILGTLGFLNIIGVISSNSNISNGSSNTVTIQDIKRVSGRTTIWKAGFEILNSSPLNYIFGVGRFNSTSVLKFENRTFTQFHNVYLDILLTGGIIELAYIGFIYFSVIRKIMKSDLEKIFKKIYFIMYITYAAYIMLESCGRFSIGAVDTLCIIFFVTVPLLHANSIKEKHEK